MISRHIELTELDQGIIGCLRTSGRASAQEIARTIGADYRIVRQRLAFLLESGAVRVNVLADPSLIGNPLVAFLWITSLAVENDLANRLADVPEVMWASMTSTQTKAVAQISCDSSAHLLALIDSLRSWPCVDEVDTAMVLRSYIGPLGASALHTRPGEHRDMDSVWLGSEEQRPFDAIDRRIFELLRIDGRIPMSAIAQAVDIPMTTANRRLTRLLESDGVRLQCRVSPAALGYRFLVGVSIQVRESARELAAALSHLPAAMWVSEITGTHAVTVELLAREQSDIDEAIATIRADRRAGAITLDYYALPIKSTGRW
ncbi:MULTISPECIES: Lrp/AsnC family transcriptional regulator [unclassified Microbacterium]|uniref:Lrp/AsnC family transcriptional regulator n=1 Tax=unclassified Microbacterium TaxID=2609290 RepID=UPI003019D54E